MNLFFVIFLVGVILVIALPYVIALFSHAIRNLGEYKIRPYTHNRLAVGLVGAILVIALLHVVTHP